MLFIPIAILSIFLISNIDAKASTNPLGYVQGGFYGGNLNPEDAIEPVLKSSTACFFKSSSILTCVGTVAIISHS